MSQFYKLYYSKRIKNNYLLIHYSAISFVIKSNIKSIVLNIILLKISSTAHDWMLCRNLKVVEKEISVTQFSCMGLFPKTHKMRANCFKKLLQTYRFVNV